MRNKLSFFVILTTMSLVIARPAAAHFAWLVVTSDDKAALFFGESLAERDYKLPPALAKTTVQRVEADGSLKEVKLQTVEGKAFVGRSSVATVPSDSRLISQTTYGVYHGARLDYYSMYQGGPLPENKPPAKQDKSTLALSAQVVSAQDGVDIYVVWRGKPLPHAEVQLYTSEGYQAGKETTDKFGKVHFTAKQVEAGLNGIMVGHTVKGESGKIDDQSYKSAAHYLTLTFMIAGTQDKE